MPITHHLESSWVFSVEPEAHVSVNIFEFEWHHDFLSLHVVKAGFLQTTFELGWSSPRLWVIKWNRELLPRINGLASLFPDLKRLIALCPDCNADNTARQ